MSWATTSSRDATSWTSPPRTLSRCPCSRRSSAPWAPSFASARSWPTAVRLSISARLPQWHQRVALGFWLLVVALGTLWVGWYIWGGLVLLLSRGRLGHPPVLDAQRPLPASRRTLAWAAVLLFVVTFAPAPFRL